MQSTFTENSRQANPFKARAGAFFASLTNANAAHVAARSSKYGFDFKSGQPSLSSEIALPSAQENTCPTSVIAPLAKPEKTIGFTRAQEVRGTASECRACPLRLRGDVGEKVPGLSSLKLMA